MTEIVIVVACRVTSYIHSLGDDRGKSGLFWRTGVFNIPGSAANEANDDNDKYNDYENRYECK
ncbi:hypothetical protein D3C72_2165510 [compost metagenome]